MPKVETASCGVPISTVNYSSMEDIINKLEAYPIQIASYFKELETKAIRVYPSNDSLKNILVEFISLSPEEKLKKQQKTRELTEKHYNWDNIAHVWEQYLDTLPTKQHEWSKSSNFMETINLDKYKEHKNTLHIFVDICLNHLKKIEKISSISILNMIQNIEYGYVQQGTSVKEYSINDAIEEINTYINNCNNAEKARTSGYVSDEDYIKYSKIKASL